MCLFNLAWLWASLSHVYKKNKYVYVDMNVSEVIIYVWIKNSTINIKKSIINKKKP